MGNRFQPLGLASLTNAVLKTELSSLPATLAAALNGVNNPATPPPKLSELLLNDPALATNVLREAARHLRQRSSLTLSGISHCLTLLGAESIANVVRNTSSLAPEALSTEDIRHREALVTSLHAAAQVGDWHSFQPAIHFEQTYLGAMLTGLPEWCLWRSAPQAMTMMDTLMREFAIPRHEAETLVFGCNFNDAILQIADTWKLSDIVVLSLETRRLPTIKSLLRWARRPLHKRKGDISYRDESVHRIEISPGIRVLLANWIAQEARRDWHGRGMRRCVTLLAAFLEISEEAAWIRIRNTALALAREVPDPMTAQLAAGLLWPAQLPPARRIPEAWRADAVQSLFNRTAVKSMPARRTEKADAVTEAVLPATVLTTAKKPGFETQEKQREFEQHLERLSGHGAPFKTIQEIIRSSVDVLYECSAIERVVVALVHPGQDVLAGYYAVGCDKTPGLQHFELGLQPPNLFTRLLKQPSAVWITPERQKDVGGLIPGSFRQTIQVDKQFVGSLFTGKGALGILYADKGITHSTLGEPDYQIFRHMVNAINHRLRVMK